MACLKSINIQFRMVFNHNKNLAKQHKNIKHFIANQHKNNGKNYNQNLIFNVLFPYNYGKVINFEFPEDKA
ncbi:hypothetical protein [Pedobacter sp. Bi36]|uniref:hypothetical protein n=1 Tax=Pedobacter sp. Bi36 TaxID=2822352 RepID=UPI001E33E38E|nr:hypothetical protein [Pedobacter sp. Bi36]